MIDHNAPAGPELDRLVHQALNNYRPTGEHTCIGTIDTGTWHPSTNLIHAWEVVERLRKLGWWVYVTYGPSYDYTLVELFSDDMPAVDRQAKGPNAPHAICLAALMVLT